MRFRIHHPAVVVLAAGRSARLGRPKQLVSKDGSTLMHRALSAACDAGLGPVYAILGSSAIPIGDELPGLPAKAVINEGWQEGISSSIRCGLHLALSDHPDTDGILFMACDQPAVKSDTLRSLMAIQQKAYAQMAVCSYGGTHGIPALFHGSLFDELSVLKGDAGAKGIIMSHSREAVFLDFPEGVTDIDTEAECIAWLAGKSEREEA